MNTNGTIATYATPGVKPSVFESNILFTRYAVEIQFRDKVLGGVPKNPEVIESWLRTKMGVDDSFEVRRLVLQTLTELGEEDIDENMSDEELAALSHKVGAIKSLNGFKRDEDGLYLEDRQVKAMLKEAVNILFSGDRWKRQGQTGTGKGPRNFTAERVFISPARIHLGCMEPDGVELMMIHTSGPKGPVNSLAYHEYCHQPTLAFEVMVANDDIKHEHWPPIWTLAQENGLGACRSQSFGRFNVTNWEKR